MTNQKELLKKITELAKKIKRDVNLMEVCGTHTQAISRHGIRGLMPANVKLTTGPGCPVCITPQEDIDAVVKLALAGIPIACYGDVMRVPGHYGSLNQSREKGAHVFSVYSVEEALKLQKKYPDLVFFGIGFETTAPMTAWLIKEAERLNTCLAVYSSHRLFLPAMKALLKMGEAKIDGFISPGHVSAIIGIDPYREMCVAQVITGFTADDVLLGIYMLLKQISEGRAEVENEYIRAVRENGNTTAREIIFEVFEPADGNWRGFGIIPDSGLEIKKKYEKFDAKVKYKNLISSQPIANSNQTKFNACKCGEIIRGLKNPTQCPLFKNPRQAGQGCSPEKPLGPCMVSVEGACNVEYRYGK